MRSCVILTLMFALSGVRAVGRMQESEEEEGVFTEHTAEGIWLRGEIKALSNEQVEGLSVELQSQGMSPLAASVDRDGEFLIARVPPGFYRLLVRDQDGRLIHAATLSVVSSTRQIEVILPAGEVEQPDIGGTVSLARLQHMVPGKARKLTAQAEAAARAGRSRDAVACFEKALAVDPDYYEARMGLGSLLLSVGQPGRSLEHFERAARLDPSSAEAWYQTGLALMALSYAEEAAIAARVALHNDAGAFQAHFVLGLAQLRLGRVSAETVASLRRAALSYPRARLAAAEALEALGLRQEAAQELRRFLASDPGESAQRERLLHWLESIERAAPPSAVVTSGMH